MLDERIEEFRAAHAKRNEAWDAVRAAQVALEAAESAHAAAEKAVIDAQRSMNRAILGEQK